MKKELETNQTKTKRIISEFVDLSVFFALFYCVL
jgi:hypothetical protein